MELGLFGKVIFWLLAIGVFLYEVYQILKGRDSESWRALSAKVLDVKIDTRTDDGEQQSKPLIKYSYDYMGSPYRGNKIKYGDLWSAKYGKASDLRSGIVRGGEVTIYVNPKRPSQSVLYRGYEGSVIWFIVFVCIFAFLAIQS